MTELHTARTDDLCYLSASEALQLFRDKELSPVELLSALKQQVDKHEGKLNALRSVRWEAAFEAARLAERRYQSGDITSQLEGIPVMLKNEHGLIGEETDQGSLLFAGERDTDNAPVTQRLLDAGAVIHARTQVPEFYIANFTRSVAHGVTRNPYRLKITCGGSSGGSGAALAAGFGPLSTASDIGGSARVPAAYCGVVGLKPSYGRMPEPDINFAMNTFNHIGLMTRSVADAALMFNVMNGPHPCDPATVRPKLQLSVPTGDVRGMRIAISPDLGYYDVTTEVLASLDQAAAMLRDAGAAVEVVSLPWGQEVPKAYTDALLFVLGRGLGELTEGAPEGTISDYVLNAVALSKTISLEGYLGSMEVIGNMHQSLQQVFERFDVLLCPTLTRHDMQAEGLPAPHDSLMQQGLTYPFNMLSRHPVMSVPGGIGANGVPMGLQIVGQTFCEADVMAVGAALERRVGWSSWRPGFID